MKSKAKVSSQVLILIMAALVIVFMIQVAQAQPLVAQNNSNQNQATPAQASQFRGSKTLTIKMPQKSTAEKILENTTFTYYQQFLGPTLSGNSNETYNVFQEGLNTPRSGRAPLQSFHAFNLRYQINSDWAVGTSLAAVNSYTEEVENRGGVVNRPDSEFFNARIYVVLPALSLPGATLYSNLAYEAPTSVISRNDDMSWGWVLTESLSFKLPSPRWSAGILAQYYRAYFNHDRNVVAPQNGYMARSLQTVIVSGGPFANYRFSDNWMVGSSLTLDWDQRGVQTDSKEFNNNLPHRGRLNLTYYPSSIKYISNVGVFAQALLKFRPETTALGADLMVKF